MNDDIRTIAEHYGLAHQSKKTVEELAELIQVLTKGEWEDGDVEHLIEEIADVEIMLSQLKYLLYISDEALDSIKHYKIMRTLAGTGGSREWKD